jgi:hypothetical protein
MAYDETTGPILAADATRRVTENIGVTLTAEEERVFDSCVRFVIAAVRIRQPIGEQLRTLDFALSDIRKTFIDPDIIADVLNDIGLPVEFVEVSLDYDGLHGVANEAATSWVSREGDPDSTTMR